MRFVQFREDMGQHLDVFYAVDWGAGLYFRRTIDRCSGVEYMAKAEIVSDRGLNDTESPSWLEALSWAPCEQITSPSNP